MISVTAVDVYVGNFGTYVIPFDVLIRARELNDGKPLTDRRTKGARYLAHWGRNQDATEETKHAITRHFGI